MVIMKRIGKSAAKLLSSIDRIWRRFRDYNGMGLRCLVNTNEGLRYSPFFIEK
jgi:hypothetical protein